MGFRKSGFELTLAYFLYFAAMVLLICVSTGPLWSKMSFMDINVSGFIYHCGVWGYTGLSRRLGYIIYSDDIGLETAPWDNVSPKLLLRLSHALILHMLAGIFAFLTLTFGLCSDEIPITDLEANWGTAGPKTGASSTMVATGLITFFLALGAMSVDIALWVAIYKAGGDIPLEGASSSLGIAFWLTLAALVSLFIAAFPWQVMVGLLIAIGFIFFILVLLFTAHRDSDD